MNNNPNAYELTYILGEKTKPEDGKQKLTELKAYIEKAGGKVTKEELWGRRELAYEIKHNRSGFYTTIWYEIPAEQIKPFNQHLRFDESIIRSMITKAVEYAQPGSLYPIVEEEKQAPAYTKKDEKSGAEEMLRMTSNKKAPKKEVKEEVASDELPEEERQKKVDAKLDELLNEDQA